MTLDSSVVTNIFLGCIALTNFVILAIFYETFRKNKLE